MRSEALETTAIDGLALHVDFLWRGDRFGQVISLVDSNGKATPLWESEEGSAVSDWPASPPLQSLHIETLPDGRRAALLIGMAGRSHWSASIEPAKGAAEITFDLACRHVGQPAWLGSRYRLLDGAIDRVAIVSEDARVRQNEERIEIEPAIPAAAPATTRWRFAFRLTSEP